MPKTATLDCGHTIEVPDCCQEGSVTACDECPAPVGTPGANCRIVLIHKPEVSDA